MKLGSLLSSTLEGLISGLIVALAVAAVSRFTHRRFELRKIGEGDLAILINHGWRSVLLGNSLFLNGVGSKDELRLGANPELPIALSFLAPNGDLVVDLRGRPAGSTVFFTFRPMLWRPRRRKKFNRLADEARNIGPFSPSKTRFRHWKEYSVTVTL